MEELLSDIYDTDRDTARYFNLRGVSVSFYGTVSDILDHGVVVLTGKFTGTAGNAIPANILVPIAHINYIQESKS